METRPLVESFAGGGAFERFGHLLAEAATAFRLFPTIRFHGLGFAPGV